MSFPAILRRSFPSRRCVHGGSGRSSSASSPPGRGGSRRRLAASRAASRAADRGRGRRRGRRDRRRRRLPRERRELGPRRRLLARARTAGGACRPPGRGRPRGGGGVARARLRPRRLRRATGAPCATAFVLDGGRWRRLPQLPEPRAAAARRSPAGGSTSSAASRPRGLARVTLVLDLAHRPLARVAGPDRRASTSPPPLRRTRVYALGGRAPAIDTNRARFEVYAPRRAPLARAAAAPARARRDRRRGVARPDRLGRRRGARRARSRASTPTTSRRGAGGGSPTCRRRATGSASSPTRGRVYAVAGGPQPGPDASAARTRASRPLMARSEASIEIARSAEDVFPWLLDADKRLRWVAGLVGSEPLGDGRYRETIGAGRSPGGLTSSVDRARGAAATGGADRGPRRRPP